MAEYKDMTGYRDLFDEEYKKTRKLIEQGETHLDNLAEGFTEADYVIRKMPTADVAEVRRGEWIEHIEKPYWLDDDVEVYYKCSVCGCNNFCTTAFCPNCGADMRGEKNEV